MITLMVWVIVGSIFGWIVGLILRNDSHRGMLLNIMVGIMGAALAGLVLSPLFGMGAITQNNFSLASLLIALVGADILLGVFNLFRPHRARNS